MNKIIFTLVATFMLSNTLFGQVSPKRGMAYGYHSVADLTKISEGCSWWYNWSTDPDAAVLADYKNIGVEFVPMFWNATFDVNNAIANIPVGAKYILAFNEPNFTVESNITPAQAADNWGRIEQVAVARNLEIVSAAPAYCGGGNCIDGYEDPIAWHDEFFDLCPTCKVDYIAFHNYEETTGGLFYLVNNLKKYNRPLWITEFACWDETQTATYKNDYLQTAVAQFESDPDIFRYSWFTGRSVNSSVALLASSGQLTTLGNFYINGAYGPKQNIPGTIQAEANYRRRGIGNETCTDSGGGQNIAFIDAGDWSEYLVEVGAAGNYSFSFRVASETVAGDFDILIDDQPVITNVTFTTSNGWQAWKTINVTGVTLPAGEHLLKLKFNVAGFNMNYFTTTFESAVAPIANFTASKVSVCQGNNVTFTNTTTFLSGSETYFWDFGLDANPATAAGAGPHTVNYTSGGQKSISLTATNANGNHTKTKTNLVNVFGAPTSCLFSDAFDNSTVNWLSEGAFDYSEDAAKLSITNEGYGEWDVFRYALNNGTSALPLNFECAANKPILKLRAKASGNCLLRATLVDQNGRAVDNYDAVNLELTNTYQNFAVDFKGKFRNYYGGSPGVVDSTTITYIQFSINPGYYSYPVSGVNATYNNAFSGTVDLDWMGIGDNSCQDPSQNLPYITEALPYCLYSGASVTLTGINLTAATNVSFNGVAGTITSNTATEIVVTVPAGLTAGKISVTTANGTTIGDSDYNRKPITSAITGEDDLCNGATGEFYSVANTVGSTYLWGVPTDGTVSAGGNTSSVTINHGSVNGDITVTEITAAGCSGDQVALPVTFTNCGLSANFNASALTVCQNNTMVFTNQSLGTSGATTYAWNFGANAIPATAIGFGPHTVSYSTIGTKDITLEITDGASSLKTKNAYITVITAPTAFAGSAQTVINENATLSATASNGIGFWSLLSGTGNFIDNTSPTTPISGLSSGLNTFRWTVSNSNCSVFDDVDITYTPVSGLNSKAQALGVHLSPNPFSEITYLEMDLYATESATVRVVDMKGIEVFTSIYKEGQVLSLGDSFSSGLYVVIVTQGEKLNTFRLMKQ